MVRKWYVAYEGQKPGPEGAFIFHYIDMNELRPPDEKYLVTPLFVENLLSLINSMDHYSIIGKIREVKNPEGEDWSRELIWTLQGLHTIDGVQQNQLGILIHELPDKDWEVLGLFPPSIIDFPLKTSEFIANFIHAFTKDPDKWFGVHVVTSKPL